MGGLGAAAHSCLRLLACIATAGWLEPGLPASLACPRPPAHRVPPPHPRPTHCSPYGTFNNEVGSDECDVCGPGQYSNTMGARSCKVGATSSCRAAGSAALCRPWSAPHQALTLPSTSCRRAPRGATHQAKHPPAPSAHQDTTRLRAVRRAAPGESRALRQAGWQAAPTTCARRAPRSFSCLLPFPEQCPHPTPAPNLLLCSKPGYFAVAIGSGVCSRCSVGYQCPTPAMK